MAFSAALADLLHATESMSDSTNFSKNYLQNMFFTCFFSSIRTIHSNYPSVHIVTKFCYFYSMASHCLATFRNTDAFKSDIIFFRRVPLNLEMSIALRLFGSLRSMRKCWRLPFSRADMLCASFAWIPRIRRDRVLSCNRHERSSVLFALMFFKYQHSAKDAAARQKR